MKSVVKISCCLLLLSVAGCKLPPAVGTDAWCKQMEQKPRADWSPNEASIFTRNCIFEKHTDE
jgi:DUF3012 family protein